MASVSLTSSAYICSLPCKAIPLQAWTGHEGSKRLRLPDLKTVGTWRWYGWQPYTLVAFTSQEIFMVLISVRWHHQELNLGPSSLERSASTDCATVYPAMYQTHSYSLSSSVWSNKMLSDLQVLSQFWDSPESKIHSYHGYCNNCTVVMEVNLWVRCHIRLETEEHMTCYDITYC